MSLFRAFRSPPRQPVEPRLRDDAVTVDTVLGRVAVTVRRSAQARRMTLRVRTATRDVTLTLPARLSILAARDFVERHVGWIEQRLARLPEHIPFADGEEIPLRGEPHMIVHRPGLRSIVRVEPGLRGEDPVIAVYGAPSSVAHRVADFLKREARRDLLEAVGRHAAALGVGYGRVSLKDTTSRWGSCSVTGDLAFSWRLVLAPPHVLDYLAAHEVAHRREMNHSPRYWAHVERLVPDYDRAEAWLKAHGATLHRFG